MNDFIPFSVPDLGEREIAAVAASMRSGWVTTGPAASAFEQEFAEFVGPDVTAVAVNSATAGLHLALEACGIGPGDEVILPTWTFTATAEVVRYLGATPVIVDVDRDSLNIDLAAMKAAITSRTRAIVVVHFAGLSVDMPAVASAVAGLGIRVIEDAAHSLPARTKGVTVGSATHSDATVFSFYATKTMTTGEGGMVTSRDAEIAARVRTMRLHGIDRDVFNRYRSATATWAYDVVAPGFKYNLPDTAASMGRVQLERANEMHQKRESIAERYTEGLADLPLRLPAFPARGDQHSWHLYVVRLNHDAPIDRDDFIGAMAERKIGTSVHFIPLHRLTYWRESLVLSDDQFPVATAEARLNVSLPLFSAMSEAQVVRVIESCREVLAR